MLSIENLKICNNIITNTKSPEVIFLSDSKIVEIEITEKNKIKLETILKNCRFILNFIRPFSAFLISKMYLFELCFSRNVFEKALTLIIFAKISLIKPKYLDLFSAKTL